MKVFGVGCNPSNMSNSKNDFSVNRNNLPYQVNFKAMLQKSTLDGFKMCVYDLDDTLLEGSQTARNNILKFSKSSLNDGMERILVYSSSRSLSKVQPLIDDGTLMMPDYYVGNNGINIYKNVKGQFKEIESWSENLAKGFSKDKIRNFAISLAKKNMFSREEWSKIPKEIIPEGQKEFRGSKITEYETYGSPLNIYFMMAPDIFKKTLPEFSKFLNDSKIKGEIKFQNFGADNLKNLEKYFPAVVARDMRNHAAPRTNPDGSVDVSIISALSDKGKASEFLRKSLNIEPKAVFAAGDDVNDLANANKGYFFGMVSNATEGLKKMLIANPDNPQVIKASKPGADGIWEIIG